MLPDHLYVNTHCILLLKLDSLAIAVALRRWPIYQHTVSPVKRWASNQNLLWLHLHVSVQHPGIVCGLEACSLLSGSEEAMLTCLLKLCSGLQLA